MKFMEWLKIDREEFQKWEPKAKRLTADEARKVMHKYVRHAFESEANGKKMTPRKLRRWLLRHNIWLSQLPKEGLDDVTVKPKPMFLDKDQDGAPRKLEVEVEPLNAIKS